MRSAFSIFSFMVAVSVVAGCGDEKPHGSLTGPLVSASKPELSEAGGHDPEARWGPWSAPINLGAVVNSADSDSHPAISRDGLSLYFSSHRAGSFDIWVSHRLDVDQPWQTPMVLGSAINTAAFELAPNLSLDGRTLYFHRNPGPCGGADIFVSHRKDPDDDSGWQTATALPCGTVNSSLPDAGPTIFEDRRMHTTVMYFTRQMTPGPSGFDILVDTLQDDGTWGVASLVPELSSPLRDTRTTISRDGREMFISSGRSGGFGSEDIWVSTRRATTELWSTPVNVGSIINSSAFDGAPALSFDGRSLYFFSERSGADANGLMSFGLRDLYVSTRVPLADDDTDVPDEARASSRTSSLTPHP